MNDLEERPARLADRGSGLDELRDLLRQSDPLHDVDVEALRRFEHSRSLWRAMRERQGLTQADVAELMRTSQSVVSELESGAADPRMSTVRRYLAALGRCMVVQPCIPGRAGLVQQVHVEVLAHEAFVTNPLQSWISHTLLGRIDVDLELAGHFEVSSLTTRTSPVLTPKKLELAV